MKQAYMFGNIVQLDKSKIIYEHLQDSSQITSCLLNYISINEINRINPLLYDNTICIHHIFTDPKFRKLGFGTKIVEFFIKDLFPSKNIILICESNYHAFNLCDWYSKIGFSEINSNLESSLFILKK